jgi:HK97 family phage major capsid protein
MGIDTIISRAAEVDAELAELAALDTLDEEQEARFDELAAEVDALVEARAKAEKRAESLERARKLAEKPENVVRGDGARVMGVVDKTRRPQDVLGSPFASRADIRSAAQDQIDEFRSKGLQDDDKLSTMYAKLERSDDSRGTIGQLVLATGSDEYMRAFKKYLAGGESMWSDDERHAIVRAGEIRAALSLTDANGGYAVPVIIDPTLILANAGSSNPFRRISRVETITNDVWRGLSTIGGTASWDPEATEVSDDSPVFTQPTVTAHKAAAFVQGSIEISQDYQGLVGDLTTAFVDMKDRLEAAAFATGTGSDQPWGIAAAVGGTANAQSTYAAGSAFKVADVYSAFADLGPRYRDRASWVMNQTTLNSVRQFGTSNNYHAFSVDLTPGGPMTLLGRPVSEASGLDSDVDAAGTALNVNNIAVLGDFSNYLIADRVGLVVEYIPHLFATANNRPSGSRGWYAYWRVGADSINDSAFQPIVTSYSG